MSEAGREMDGWTVQLVLCIVIFRYSIKLFTN